MRTREKFYDLINGITPNRYSAVYNGIILLGLLLSIVPLLWRKSYSWTMACQTAGAVICLLDYFCHWLTADYKLKKGAASFAYFPFTLWAIVCLIAIIASFGIGPRPLILFRVLNVLRMLRVFGIVRRSPEYQMLSNVFKQNSRLLLTLLSFVFIYVFIVALILYNIEPHSFPTFLDAIYWSLITLAGIGYGDIVPVTAMGKLITIFSAFLGIAIITLPSGFIAAAFMEELENRKNSNDDD